VCSDYRQGKNKHKTLFQEAKHSKKGVTKMKKPES
jgi:hypothetical protein